MGNVPTMIRREVGAYFLSPIAYIVMAIFLLACGLAFGLGTFRAGGEVYELRSGDSLHFKTALPSVWSNEGTEPATLLFVVSLPEAIRRFLRPRPRNPGRFAATGRSRSTG